ncbi:hypothetical protein R3P38DRAFT_2918632 [Favolaschia claudopus]|uniref:GATA-type domain-containing protein n=1 Tax=Favolaschia claudopus TaxID=2862362 RepID=A0AAW0C2B8_9AGAR
MPEENLTNRDDVPQTRLCSNDSHPTASNTNDRSVFPAPGATASTHLDPSIANNSSTSEPSSPTTIPLPTSPPPAPAGCFNCGTTTKPLQYKSALNAGRRLCQACHGYERKRQKARPPVVEAKRHSRIAGRKCTNCGTTSSSGNWGYSQLNAGWMLCCPCNMYERQHSESRPSALYNKHRKPKSSRARQDRVNRSRRALAADTLADTLEGME